MSITEIILIIAGTAVLLLGYFLPAKREEKHEMMPQIDEAQIKELVENEVDQAKAQIKDIVEETVTYSMEKTERTMERMTNEKIMAINEYSDTVLETINKNHKETVFLYDMLNDKHDDLVSEVGNAAQTVKELRQVQENLEKPERKKKQFQKEDAITEVSPVKVEDSAPESTEDEVVDFVPIAPEKVIIIGETGNEYVSNETGYGREAAVPEVEINFADKEENNNEKILSLHKMGKSKTAIARELGLGVGEVKLVIDLFEGV